TEDVGLTDRLSEAVIRSVIETAPKVFANPEDYQARAELMWASTIAHNDVTGLGREHDWASHQIQHELSAQYDVAHGAGLAVVFPAWMTHVRKENLSRFVQFALRVWNVDYVAGREDEIALEGIRRHRAFYESIGMPTNLTALGVNDNRYGIMADKAMRDGSFGGLKKLNKEDVIAIYTLAGLMP
ncbi:MAG: NADH-dependent alcohol dehydrogenase, partial [Spirochaetes bacterium]